MVALSLRVSTALLGVLLTAGCASVAPTVDEEDDAGAPRTTDSPSAPAAPPAEASPAPPPPPPPPQLPRGGRELFPTHRLVGFSGAPGSQALGRLTGDLDAAAAQLEPLAAEYAAGRRPLPVFELIATVVHDRPGADGTYRTRVGDEVVQQYLDAARRHRALLLLNLQPGLVDFLPEVQSYERWLREPDVSVALDPEWAVEPGQVPGRAYGRTTGAELDGVAAYLSSLVAQGDLPEKPLVFHQVAPQVVEAPELLQPHPGVQLIRSVDGIGVPAEKVATWTRITTGQPPHVRGGFKLFFEEDTERGPLMTSPEVLALVPQPEYVLFE